MMHKVINGYTVVAHNFVPREGLYYILGSRRIGPASYEYVIAGLRHIDDDQWVTSGHYPATLSRAFEIYSAKVAI